MSEPYMVQAGENLTVIARRYYMTWQALYNSSDNAEFRAKRPNPNLIFRGDIINVPGGPAARPSPVKREKSDIKVVAADIRKELAGADDADLEFLARLFEDDRIDDGPDPTLANRLQQILAASTDGRNNGVTHFSGIYAGCHDLGFRKVFKDPWPSSDNQVGHFTTAVDMGFRPMQSFALVPNTAKVLLNRLPTPLPKDEYVCLRLIIGHEQVSDTALFHNQERAFLSPSEEEVVAFFKATFMVGASALQNVQATRAALSSISIGTGQGNSMQDLHLSLFGYRFGQMIRRRTMTDRLAAARWIRINIGDIKDNIPETPPGSRTG